MTMLLLLAVDNIRIQDEPGNRGEDDKGQEGACRYSWNEFQDQDDNADRNEKPAAHAMGAFPGNVAHKRPGRSDAHPEVTAYLAQVVAHEDENHSQQSVRHKCYVYRQPEACCYDDKLHSKAEQGCADVETTDKGEIEATIVRSELRSQPDGKAYDQEKADA